MGERSGNALADRYANAFGTEVEGEKVPLIRRVLPHQAW